MVAIHRVEVGDVLWRSQLTRDGYKNYKLAVVEVDGDRALTEDEEGERTWRSKSYVLTLTRSPRSH